MRYFIIVYLTVLSLLLLFSYFPDWGGDLPGLFLILSVFLQLLYFPFIIIHSLLVIFRKLPPYHYFDFILFLISFVIWFVFSDWYEKRILLM